MSRGLPDEVAAADDALAAAYHATDPARLLNPLNVAEAQAAFLAGADEPPFRYAHNPTLRERAVALRALPLPESHPFGPLLRAAVSSFDAMAEALTERSAEAFERWAQLERWEEGADHAAEPAAEPTDAPEPLIGAAHLRAALEGALHARGLGGWAVRWDEVMSARVLVESNQREIRVNPAARFRASDVPRLIAHELDVHVTRAQRGAAQPLRLFATGLPGSLQTEEGLAVLAEARVGTLSAASLARQADVRAAIRDARSLGFRALWESRRARFGPRGAFTLALRIKRGLATPGGPGVYAKDAVYGLGYATVRRWLGAGGPMGWMYVGKVGVHHPIGEWLEAGLITPGHVPPLWGPPFSPPG